MNGQIEEIKPWIIKGDHDLGTAKITYLHIPEFLDTVTFHCQQATEKYLKGYLIYLNEKFRFSHDLVYLLDLISINDSDFENFYDDVSELQGYAVEIRYPNETIYLSDEKVQKALLIARNIRNFVVSKMNISVDYNEILDF